MIYVEQWLPGFLARHRMRYRPFDWPEAGTEEAAVYARMWLRAFIDKDVTESEADEASESLATSPPRFRSDHVPAVIRAIESDRARRRPAFVCVPCTPAEPDPIHWPEDMTPGEYWRALALRQGARPEDVNRLPRTRRRKPWHPPEAG